MINNDFEKSIIELIKSRRSSRSYDGRDIDKTKLDRLSAFLNETLQESKSSARISITNVSETKKKKLGTYGFITGAKSFIVGIIEKNKNDALEFGYLFEKAILKATDLGIQTCWLGGTFNKKDFSQNVDLKSNEFIAVISPIGYQKKEPRLMESAIRSFAKANTRKSWQGLFFDDKLVPLSKESAGFYATPLEMVRLGPSASNMQPWRIIKEDNNFHFLIHRTIGHQLNYDMQLNDIGIAKCHFELTAGEIGLSGGWETKQKVYEPNGMEYVCSWMDKTD